jgi:hypothetical protein
MVDQRLVNGHIALQLLSVLALVLVLLMVVLLSLLTSQSWGFTQM